MPGRVVAAVLVTLLAACSGAGEESRPAPHDLAPADAEARARAMKMIQRAGQCEARAAPRDVEACAEACELGHSNSCGWLGEAYESGQGVARHLVRSHAYYHRACEGGSGLGCEGEARGVRDGIGAPPDPAAAERLFAEARIVYRVHCEQRHAVSCVRLANLYARGLGGLADDRVALTYRQRACALGDRASC